MAILYKANETDFTHFGLGPLNDAVSILVTEERNGIFELTMEYPVSGSQFEELKNDRLIKADAGHNLKNQRFKVIRITKPLKGIVTVYAEHVSYLAQDLALRPRVPFSGNAEQALLSWQDGLVDDNPFIVSSDITTRGNGVWTIDEVENPRRALGGVDGSILDVYGGEYHFNNYQIRLMKQRGVNSATLIAYGRNLVDLTQEEEIANTYTSIYPYSVFTDEDGEQQLVTLPEYYVDSEHVDNFARRKILAVDFTTDEIETEDALRSAANRYITANNVGVPKVNLKIKYLDLAKTLDYKHQAVLEEVNLCDNVPVYFEKFDINTTAKVIKTVWDDLRGQYDSVEIGEARSSLSQSINATVDGKLEKVEKQITNVQIQADGMKLIYRQKEEPPPGENVGDLWYQPDGQYEIMYQWDGSMWKEVLNTRDLESVKRDVDEALEDAKSAKNRANESVEKAELATSNANEAIEQAQGAFDKAQESLEGLETLVSITNKQGEELTTIKGGIEGLEVSVTDAKDNIATLQVASDSFASRIEDAEGNISSISQTADGLQRRMSDAEGNIASVTELATGMQTRLTDAEGNINTLTTTASSLESTITGVRDDLDGLEIGGRNLYTESGEPYSGRYSYNPSVVTIDGRMGLAYTNDGSIIAIKALGKDLEVGEEYTFSFYAKASREMSIGRVYINPSNSNFLRGVQISTTWKRYSFTFVVKTSGSGVHVHMYPNKTGSDIFYLANWQLEKGNKATDWSPAPEDVQSQITQLADNINLRVEIGDVINQINISDEEILISGNKLILDGETTVTGTFRVKDANIESVSADKMTVGTLNGANVNIINLNASNIVGGTIDTNLLTVRGGSGTEYTMIDGATLESRGHFTKTWFGQTETHDVRLRFAGGQMRAESMTDSRRLYYSHDGISTYYKGSNEDDDGLAGSGVIEFFSHLYEPNVRGLTLYSNRGTIGIRAATRDIYLDAERFVVIPNNNLYTERISTLSSSTNFYVGVSGANDGELRVTNKLFWQGSHSDTRYMPIRARGVHGKWFVSPDNFMYLGSDAGVRVTSRGVNNLNPIIYRQIQAKEFNEASSRRFKTNISPTKVVALDAIRDLELMDFNLINDLSEGVNDLRLGLIAEDNELFATQDKTGIRNSKLLMYNTKAIQELDTKIDDEVSALRKEKEELVMKVAELESRINKMESAA